MSDASPLLVPITCEALVVNDLVRTGERWLRLTMAYADLTNPPGTATPRDPSQADPLFTAQPGTDVAPGITSSQFYNGVYLKWRLPPALLRGAVDNRTGETRFPPMPNRWLVVRLGGVDPANRTAAAWIIESDFVNPQGFAATTSSGRSAPYVVGGDADPTSIAIGRNVALGAWTEPGTSLRLTAMAPGNPAFAWSQPSCNNVLSFIDPLGAGAAPDQPLSYLVVGWYSDPADDPLAGAKDFDRRLHDLGWRRAAGGDPTATASWSLLVGVATTVGWTSGAVDGGAPEGPVAIAVGRSSAEALTALIAGQAGGDRHVDPELLEAFQLGAFDLFDRPDGAALLAEQVERHGFARVTGGYHWELVDAPSPLPEAGRAATGDAIGDATGDAVLATLNQAQAALDAAVLTLHALERQLYVLWWKLQNFPWVSSPPPPPAIDGLGDDQRLRAELDPRRPGSVAAAVVAQLDLVAQLAAAVPTGATPARAGRLDRGLRRGPWRAGRPRAAALGGRGLPAPSRSRGLARRGGRRRTGRAAATAGRPVSGPGDHWLRVRGPGRVGGDRRPDDPAGRPVRRGRRAVDERPGGRAHHRAVLPRSDQRDRDRSRPRLVGRRGHRRRPGRARHHLPRRGVPARRRHRVERQPLAAAAAPVERELRAAGLRHRRWPGLGVRRRRVPVDRRSGQHRRAAGAVGAGPAHAGRGGQPARTAAHLRASAPRSPAGPAPRPRGADPHDRRRRRLGALVPGPRRLEPAAPARPARGVPGADRRAGAADRRGGGVPADARRHPDRGRARSADRLPALAGRSVRADLAGGHRRVGPDAVADQQQHRDHDLAVRAAGADGGAAHRAGALAGGRDGDAGRDRTRGRDGRRR
jgi:hypothetical protein